MYDFGETTTASLRQMESKYSVVKEKGFKRTNTNRLSNFVEDEMTLVNDQIFSREAVSQCYEKGPYERS